MNFIYEGKDITNYIDIKKADIIENSGIMFDNLLAYVNNSANEWSQWKPKKNDRLEFKNNGFTSGNMYIDEIEQQRALITLKALPIKQKDKQTNTKIWEEIRLIELLNEFASKHGLTLKTYNLENYKYFKVNQINLTDFSFLYSRCALEGYILKISNGEMIVYNEKYTESQSSGVSIDASEVDGDFIYKDKSDEIYGRCNIISGNINYTFTAPKTYGPTLNIRGILVNDLAEAERFSRNLLRNKNKFEKILRLSIKLNTCITAGNTVEIKNFGLPDGNYYIYQAIHKLTENTTKLKLRKVLEEY